MNTELYPIIFQSIFKEKIWGGKRLKTLLNKPIDSLDNCGESWEISGVKGDVSIVANGHLKGLSINDLIEKYGAEFVGEKVFSHFKSEFPLLVKFIDADQELSIQVHPNDKIARRKHHSMGKSEMWYVLDADKGASLICGFNRSLDAAEFRKILENKQLETILNREWVAAGDYFYIPAGRVHNIGKGMVLAEIQQCSDITYRLYDFERKDVNGNERELHIEDSIEALDYKSYPAIKQSIDLNPEPLTELINSPYFICNRIEISDPLIRDYESIDSFRILITIGGQGILRCEDFEVDLQPGTTVLIPAIFTSVELSPDENNTLKLLETYLG